MNFLFFAMSKFNYTFHFLDSFICSTNCTMYTSADVAAGSLFQCIFAWKFNKVPPSDRGEFRWLLQMSLAWPSSSSFSCSSRSYTYLISFPTTMPFEYAHMHAASEFAALHTALLITRVYETQSLAHSLTLFEQLCTRIWRWWQNCCCFHRCIAEINTL